MTTRIEKDFVINSGVYLNNTFLINTFNFTLSIYVETDDPREQHIAIERIIYFLQEKINNSIFIFREEKKIIELYKKANLNTILLPEEPYDQIVGMVLLLKLNAIMENKMHITDLNIESALSDGVRFTIVNEIAENILDNDEWYNRNSLETQTINQSDAKVVKLFEDCWAEVGLIWKEKKEKGKQNS